MTHARFSGFGRFAIAGLLTLLWQPARGADLPTELKERLDATSAHGRLATTVNGTVGIIVFDVRDTRTFAGLARRKVVPIAVSGAGDVTGYVLRKNGTPACSFAGSYDGTCLTLFGCVSGTRCN